MEDKCQVIFFPLKFAQSEKKLDELNRIQDILSIENQNIEYDCKNAYEFVVRKQGLANRIRDCWEIIEGDL